MPIEILLCAILLGLASWILSGIPSRRAHRALLGVVAIGGVTAFSVVAAIAWLPAAAPTAPVELPLQRADEGYVGSGACRACHPRNYATWHRTWHRTMTQVATPATMLPTTTAKMPSSGTT